MTWITNDFVGRHPKVSFHRAGSPTNTLSGMVLVTISTWQAYADNQSKTFKTNLKMIHIIDFRDFIFGISIRFS